MITLMNRILENQMTNYTILMECICAFHDKLKLCLLNKII